MTRFFIFDKTWFLQNSIMKCIGIRPYEKCINEDGGVILKPIGGFRFWFRFTISIIGWIIFESLFFRVIFLHFFRFESILLCLPSFYKADMSQ